jgi:hypothetical protein
VPIFQAPIARTIRTHLKVHTAAIGELCVLSRDAFLRISASDSGIVNLFKVP